MEVHVFSLVKPVAPFRPIKVLRPRSLDQGTCFEILSFGRNRNITDKLLPGGTRRFEMFSFNAWETTEEREQDEQTVLRPCRIHFVFAGPKFDYTDFPNLQDWFHMADPACTIDFIRPAHPGYTIYNDSRPRYSVTT
jgi:hypothetical protein